MKNTLKKVLCTALAAVSLSAMVTVPSSLNAPKTNNAVVNVMEADAAEKELYKGYITEGTHYYTRSSASKKNDNNIYKNSDLGNEALYKYKIVSVYEEKNNFARISPKGEKGKNGKERQRWVYKPRVFKQKEQDFTSCRNYGHGSWNKVHSTFISRNGKLNAVILCKACGRTWEVGISSGSSKPTCSNHANKPVKRTVVLYKNDYFYDIIGRYTYCADCGHLISSEYPKVTIDEADYERYQYSKNNSKEKAKLLKNTPELKYIDQCECVITELSPQTAALYSNDSRNFNTWK